MSLLQEGDHPEETRDLTLFLYLFTHLFFSLLGLS